MYGVGECMEWGSVWSGGVYGVEELMECGSGWSVVVGSGGVYGLHGCVGTVLT